MKKVLYIGIGIALIGLISFVLVNNKKKNERDTVIVAQKNEAVRVKVDQVKEEKIVLNFVANGNFIPSQDLNFSAENSGRVTAVLVDVGSVVKVGQTLAIIKGDKLSVELQNASATYQNALADNQRYENAYKTGGVTKQQLDQASLNLVTAKAKLDNATINYGDAIIKSSINGIVNKRNIEPGSVVSSGTPLFELVNVSKLKLKVTVDESQIAHLKLGTTVKVKAGIYPDKEFSGKITFIAPKSDVSLNFPVEIEIVNNSDNDLKAGMYGTVVFSSSEANQKSVITVSRSAFIGSVNSNEVFVIKDDIAHLTKIVSGTNFGDKVAVLKGLKLGDIVVISGQINLTDGAKVTVVK